MGVGQVTLVDKQVVSRKKRPVFCVAEPLFTILECMLTCDLIHRFSGRGIQKALSEYLRSDQSAPEKSQAFWVDFVENNLTQQDRTLSIRGTRPVPTKRTSEKSPNFGLFACTARRGGFFRKNAGSGIDVWVKKVRDPLMNTWHKKTELLSGCP